VDRLRRLIALGMPVALPGFAAMASAQPAAVADASVLRITGQVAQAAAFTAPTLLALPAASDVPPIAQTTRDGVVKGTLAGYRGIRLTDLLDKVQVESPDRNSLKRTYVLASATDGYAVVFSWSELYNTPVGAGVYVLLQKDGAPIGSDEGPLTLISGRDLFTGPRHVRNLCQIDVRRA
jgi:hypothetical protein